MQTTSSGAPAGGPGAGLVAPVPITRRVGKWLRSDRTVAILVLTPSIVAVAVFIYTFIIWTFYLSGTQWTTPVQDLSFAGLDNWIGMLQDTRWQQDIRNMAFYAVGFIGQCIIIGFLLAALLDQNVKGENILRTIYVFPFAVSGIVTGVVWRWLMNPGTGINLIFDGLGLGFLKWNWFSNADWGIFAVSIAGAWQFTGYVMALYLAGLKGIAPELREAAMIDGCNTFNLYRRIIIPLLSPVTITALVLTGMGSIRVFDLPAVLGTGAAFGADAMAFYQFTLTFTSQNYAAGATVAAIMILLAAILIVPYMLSMRGEAER